MDRFDKIYRLHAILSNHRTPIPLEKIKEQLECSQSTATRIIEILRDYLNAPLEYNREANGYFYNQQSSIKRYELPGLWFSAEELRSLLICQQLLHNISPGILSEQIDSMQRRITIMLSEKNSPHPVIADKIQFTMPGRRLKDDSHFKRIATALFSNKKIQIQYQARGHNSEQSVRTLSAQKLIFYRDNWYLTAYCHTKNDLRLFSVDRIHSAQMLDKTALQIPNDQLENYIQSSYGIFTGKAKYIAVLEFTKNRANWVADELWHPEQQSEWLENGNYQLSIPFCDSRELLMDILKYGADVEIIKPQFLRVQIKDQIGKMQKIYKNN